MLPVGTMRTRSVALPFHRADVLLVYGAAGILIVTLALIASGRDHREAAARPAAPAAASAIVPATSPGGFGVRPARMRRDDEPPRDERRRDEPRIVQVLYEVRRSVF